jgi:hypothetical protein
MENAVEKTLVDEASQHFAPRGKGRGRSAIVQIDRKAFAERLSRAIRESRLSYLETARRAQKYLPNGATISDASVWSYAKGRTLPRRMAHVEALARVLGFSAREVIESDGLAPAPYSGEDVPGPEAKGAEAGRGAPTEPDALEVVDVGGGRARITIRRQLPWQLAIEILDLVKAFQPDDPEN